MRGVSAISALLTALLCVGCTDGGSPAGPSSFRGDNLTTNSAAGQGASMGASVSPIPSAARVPFRGTFEGSQTTTPLGPTQAFSVVSATGTATLLGPFTVEIPHTVDFAAQTGDGTYTFTGAERRHADDRLPRGSEVGSDYFDCGARDDHGWHRAIRRSGGNVHRPPAVQSRQRRDYRFVRGDSVVTWCRKVVTQKRRRAPARRLGGAAGPHAGFGFLQQLGSGDDRPTAGGEHLLPVKTLAAFERVCGYGTRVRLSGVACPSKAAAGRSILKPGPLASTSGPPDWLSSISGV